MKYAEVLSSGRIVAIGNSGLDAPPNPVDRLVVDIGDQAIGFDTHVYDVGVGFSRIPDRPSESHTFNYEARQWDFEPEKAWAEVRARRNRLMAASDWRVTAAMERGKKLDAAWQSYRQALRDVTEQDDPLNIVWPVAPQA